MLHAEAPPKETPSSGHATGMEDGAAAPANTAKPKKWLAPKRRTRRQRKPAESPELNVMEVDWGNTTSSEETVSEDEEEDSDEQNEKADEEVAAGMASINLNPTQPGDSGNETFASDLDWEVEGSRKTRNNHKKGDGKHGGKGSQGGMKGSKGGMKGIKGAKGSDSSKPTNAANTPGDEEDPATKKRRVGGNSYPCYQCQVVTNHHQLITSRRPEHMYPGPLLELGGSDQKREVRFRKLCVECYWALEKKEHEQRGEVYGFTVEDIRDKARSYQQRQSS